MKFNLVVPALKASGGVIQALVLAEDLLAEGGDVQVTTMWKLAPAQVATRLRVAHLAQWSPRRRLAFLQLPWIVWRAWRAATAGHARATHWVFTHFATFAFVWSVPASRRTFFVQDLEWTFVRNPTIQRLLRWFIVRTLRHGRRVAANDYLRGQLLLLGLAPVHVFPVWADAAFGQVPVVVRDVDVVMVLRRGAHKRFDLYLEALKHLKNLRVAVISTDDDLARKAGLPLDCTLVRPSMAEMAALYSRSRVFLMLSEHEGFGLPPLEAMAAGCVPVCRDSGGVRAYMERSPLLADLVLPLQMPLTQVLERVSRLLGDEDGLQAASVQSQSVFMDGLVSTRLAQRAFARRMSGHADVEGARHGH